jgi:hypothetical protein
MGTGNVYGTFSVRGAASACGCGYVVDPVPLGTAGAVKNAQSLLTGDRSR